MQRAERIGTGGRPAPLRESPLDTAWERYCTTQLVKRLAVLEDERRRKKMEDDIEPLSLEAASLNS